MNEPNTTDAAAEPSELAIKLLTKLAKSTKGILPIAELLEIAPLLGWRVSRTTIPRAGLSVESGKRVRAALEAVGLPGSHTTDYAWTYPRVEIYTRELAAQGRTALASTGTVLPKGAKPPVQVPDAERGAVFVRVDPPSPSDPHYVRANVWTACEGYLVEGPQGPLGPVWIERRRDDSPTGMADRPAGFWTWAYKAGLAKLAAEALAALGDIATRRRRPEHPAGDDHTGLCQICGRRQKMRGVAVDDLTMVDHGYTHENTGHSGRSWSTHGCLGPRQNSCFGVGYKPWEIDSSRLRWYRDTYVVPAVENLTAYLKKLRAGEVEKIFRMEQGHAPGSKIEFNTYTPESTVWPKYTSIRSWADMLRWETDSTVQELKQTKSSLAIINQRLDGWKRTPLYDELHPPVPARAASSMGGG